MVTTGKYLNGASPKGARMEFFKGYMARYRAERPTAALEEYCKIAQKYGSEYASAQGCLRGRGSPAALSTLTAAALSVKECLRFPSDPTLYVAGCSDAF